ncbi:MAG: RluA family pseudouridine synthase [Anaerolineae bacterium]
MDRFIVSKQEEGERLLTFLRGRCTQASSVKAIKRAVESKACKINGRVECFSSHILRAGDVVEFDMSKLSASLKTKTSLDLSILYEDEELLICDKPPGIVCHNDEFNKRLPRFRGRLQLIHRLDKETSGAILLSKNENIVEEMIALFRAKKVEKTYVAIVDGAMHRSKGVIDTFLTKKHAYQGQSIYGSAPRGQHAITYWKCLKRGKSLSFVLLKPLTGRTHQLRVHLSECGHPILGDYQYAKTFSCPFTPQRHLLHAYRLRFCHPHTKNDIDVFAPIPKDFFDEGLKKILEVNEIPKDQLFWEDEIFNR